MVSSRDRANFTPLITRSGKAGELQIPVFHGICDPRCQGFAVDDYGFTLGALLERSGNPVCGDSEALRLLQRWGVLGQNFQNLWNIQSAGEPHRTSADVLLSIRP